MYYSTKIPFQKRMEEPGMELKSLEKCWVLMKSNEKKERKRERMMVNCFVKVLRQNWYQFFLYIWPRIMRAIFIWPCVKVSTRGKFLPVKFSIWKSFYPRKFDLQKYLPFVVEEEKFEEFEDEMLGWWWWKLNEKNTREAKWSRFDEQNKEYGGEENEQPSKNIWIFGDHGWLNHRDALYADIKCLGYKMMHIYEPLLVTTLKHILTFAGIKCYFKLLHL